MCLVSDAEHERQHINWTHVKIYCNSKSIVNSHFSVFSVLKRMKIMSIGRPKAHHCLVVLLVCHLHRATQPSSTVKMYQQDHHKIVLETRKNVK